MIFAENELRIEKNINWNINTWEKKEANVIKGDNKIHNKDNDYHYNDYNELEVDGTIYRNV